MSLFKGYDQKTLLRNFTGCLTLLTPWATNALSDTKPDHSIIDDSGVLTKSSISFSKIFLPVGFLILGLTANIIRKKRIIKKAKLVADERAKLFADAEAWGAAVKAKVGAYDCCLIKLLATCFPWLDYYTFRWFLATGNIHLLHRPSDFS